MLLWLACVVAGANGLLTVPAAKRDAVGKAADHEVAAETQTARLTFEQGFARATRRRPGCVDDTSTSDVRGYGCDPWYDAHPEECGRHDDEGFSAKEQCCTCGGGTYPTSARRLLPQEGISSFSYDRRYSHSDSYSYGGTSTETTTTTQTTAPYGGGPGYSGPVDVVLCPGLPPSDYCDCGGDCYERPELCSCAEAISCCGGGYYYDPGYVSDDECVNDDSTTDIYGDTCSSYYDNNPGDCVGYDDDDFTASEQCCACGGGLSSGTQAPTVTPKPTTDPSPMPTSAPTTPAPTADPSPRPTFAPTVSSAPTPVCTCDKELEVTVRTDMYPWETSWTVTGVDCSRSGVLAERNDYVDHETTYVDTITLCEGGTYRFEIFDSFGDGLCCGISSCDCTAGGFYSLKLDGVEIQRGGDFGSGDVYEFFGTNAPTFAPTVTPKPSREPTSEPTASPLVAVDGYGDDGIRTAVALWLSNRDKAIKKYGHISTWETGGVTDMSYLFCGDGSWGECVGPAAALFNDTISAWDTSGVTAMQWMFRKAIMFDQPIGGWRIDKVRSMEGTFFYASSFNQPLGGWRVDSVTNMYAIFHSAKSFNQPLNDWRVDKVTNMVQMFLGASSFNQPLNDWRVDKVTTMFQMFNGASSFNQPLGEWRVDNLVTMGTMFWGASSFDQVLGWCMPNGFTTNQAFMHTRCQDTLCGLAQGLCSAGALVADYCELKDQQGCGGVLHTFLEVSPNPFAGINGGQYYVPVYADLDGDGKADLLVGQRDGTVALYRNVASGFQLVVENDPFAGVEVNGHATPALVDLDGDGKLDLVVGAADGKVYFHNGSLIEGPFSGVDVGAHSAPAFADLDGDGLVDLVVSCARKFVAPSR